MLTYPNINPIAFSIGPFDIRWYGIMYVLGFFGAFWVAVQLGKSKPKPFTYNDVADLLFYCAIGVIFGGTWGYLLFYEPGTLLHDPLALLKFWEPGRSFHGGLVGVIIAVLVYCRVHHRRILEVGDILAPAVPIGLATGRIGNFLNGELWGRVTDVPWGMVFPYAGPLPRHPSQLYEFLLEGVLLFIILYSYAQKPRKEGVLSGLFLILYGIARCFVEFFRAPDISQGFLAWNFLTMGQLLSLPMILGGLWILYIAHKNRNIVNSQDHKVNPQDQGRKIKKQNKNTTGQKQQMGTKPEELQ